MLLISRCRSLCILLWIFLVVVRDSPASEPPAGKGAQADVAFPTFTAACIGENRARVAGTITNQGAAPAGAFIITIYLNYYDLSFFVLGEVNISSLAPGQTVPFNGDLNIDPFYVSGQSYISATADLERQLDESARANNEVRDSDIYLPCEAPRDLVALRVYFLTNSAGTGEPVETFVAGESYWAFFDYRVDSTAIVDVPVRVEIDGEALCGGTIDGMAGGVIRTDFCNDPWTAVTGLHTVVARLDPNNQVAETDGGNNTATLNFGVGVATPTSTPTVTPTSTPTNTPTPTPSQTPTSTPTPLPTLTPTTTPTFVPSPTPTPHPASVSAYLRGFQVNPTGFDINSDGAIDVADLLSLLQ